MFTLSFKMPRFYAHALDKDIQQLIATTHKSLKSMSIVTFRPTRGLFRELEITYLKGDEILFRYEAVLQKQNDPGSHGLESYSFLSAQFFGQRREDFGTRDVGPFWRIFDAALFQHLNPTWFKDFRTTTDYEDNILAETVKDLLIS
jgi:hypothetical protein